MPRIGSENEKTHLYFDRPPMSSYNRGTFHVFLFTEINIYWAWVISYIYDIYAVLEEMIGYCVSVETIELVLGFLMKVEKNNIDVMQYQKISWK